MLKRPKKGYAMLFSFVTAVKKIFNKLYGEKDYIFFLHIHKCGGLSIEHAIRRHYAFSNIRVDEAASVAVAKILHEDDPFVNKYYHVFKVREQLLLYFMGQKIHCISGHFCYSERAYHNFHKRYKFITILRDPVRRWISHYFYNAYKTHSNLGKIEEDLISFLDSDRARNWGRHYVQMIGGLNESGDYSSQQAVDRAKENLHKFDIVGCLEDLETFCKQFEQRCGIKLKISKKNLNPQSPSHIQSAITKEIEEEITHICQPDLEIYNYAINALIEKK